MEEEENARLAEESRILDLKEKCKKKGLDFEAENQKYLDKQAEKRAKAEAAAEARKAKEAAKEAAKAAKAAVKDAAKNTKSGN